MRVHVCRGLNPCYQVRVRLPGFRRYILVGGPLKSKDAAYRALARRMATGSYKRGDVMLCADWYEPLPVVEMVKP